MLNKKTLVWGGAGLGSVAAFGALFTFIVSRPTPDVQLKIALSVLDKGHWDVAGRVTRDLENRVDQETNGIWHYVRGVAALKSVEKRLTHPTSRATLVDATTHLEQAKEIGFPAGYRGKGSYYLGWCYFQTYRWDDAVEELSSAPLQWPEKRSDALQMVIAAQLRKQPSDLQRAEQSIRDWKKIPGMTGSELASIKLAEAELALLTNNMQQCESLLLQVDESVPEFYAASVLRGRWRLEYATKNDEDYGKNAELLQEAMQIFRKTKISAETPTDVRRHANYLAGRTLRAQSKLTEALGRFSSLRQSDPHSAEAIAAGVEETEILLEMNDLIGSLATSRSFLRNMGDMMYYNEFWLTAPELKQRLLDVGRAMRDRGEYPEAIRMAENIMLAFPPSDSVRLQGEVYTRWASDLEDALPGALEARPRDRRSVNEKHLAAAERFERLSKLELRSSDYTNILWQAIASYQSANRLEQANLLLRDYLKFEAPTKRPRGFLALGKNQMNSGRWQAAIEPLERCLIEYPTHPVIFEARLLAAQSYAELNQLDRAVELLEENLQGHKLTPKNIIWRDSLFELGQVVYRQGDQLILDIRLNPSTDWAEHKLKLEESQRLFSVAMDRLGEAFSRWQDDPRHYDARYLFARAHRMAAEMPTQIVAANPDMIESARRKHLQNRRDLLERAMQEYHQLHQSINRRIDTIQSPGRIVSLVRNCYFGEADTLYELGRWEEAIQAYQRVTAKFMSEPESLEALLQMAQCYRRLNRNADAAKVLNTARQVLARIPPESDSKFATLTRGSRQDWENLIGMMQTWN